MKKLIKLSLMMVFVLSFLSGCSLKIEFNEKEKSPVPILDSYKIDITNITNDTHNFYITLKNSTGYKLVEDNGNKRFDIDIYSGESEIHVIIMDIDRHAEVVADCILEKNQKSHAAFIQGPIYPYQSGQIKVSIPKGVKPNTRYSILIEALDFSVSEKYTSI